MINLGEKIHLIRKSKGLSRGELADGICDESTLFRLEKGKQYPRLEVFVDLSMKLGVSLDYLLTPVNKETYRYMDLCRELVYTEDYLALELGVEYLEKEVKKHSQADHLPYIEKFITWHKAILFHKKEHKLQHAIDLLLNILCNNEITEMDINISNSLGLIYIDLEELDQARDVYKKYFKALHQLLELKDNTLYPRIGYNYAFTLYYLDEKNDALDVAYKVLNYINSQQSLYLLGEIHHMIGMILKEHDWHDEAICHLSKSMKVFSIEEQQQNFETVKRDYDNMNGLSQVK